MAIQFYNFAINSTSTIHSTPLGAGGDVDGETYIANTPTTMLAVTPSGSSYTITGLVMSCDDGAGTPQIQINWNGTTATPVNGILISGGHGIKFP